MSRLLCVSLEDGPPVLYCQWSFVRIQKLKMRAGTHGAALIAPKRGGIELGSTRNFVGHSFQQQPQLARSSKWQHKERATIQISADLHRWILKSNARSPVRAVKQAPETSRTIPSVRLRPGAKVARQAAATSRTIQSVRPRRVAKVVSAAA